MTDLPENKNNNNGNSAGSSYNSINGKTGWKSIVSILYSRRHNLTGLLTDEETRVRLQFFCVYIIFGVVSAVMTVVNVFTHFHLLMLSTLIFAILNIVNVALALISAGTERLSRICFVMETAILFLFFIIIGEPEGFSAIWVVLLPSSGMLLYRLKYGSILTVGELLLLVFLCWTPIGRSLILYEGYTDSFLLRFPLLYTAAAIVGAFFEYIRQLTQSELTGMREKYEYLSKHDALTGLYNRSGFYSGIDEMTVTMQNGDYAFAILDLDHFKNVNDRYGHLNGDTVLKTTAAVISKVVGDAGWVSRWGGEEFAIFLRTETGAEELCGKILDAFRIQTYCFNNESFRVTVSIGLVRVAKGARVSTNDLIAEADRNLYTSKESGRDRQTVTRHGT